MQAPAGGRRYMPDWKQFVRERLKLPQLTAAHEAEIVEDLALQLEEAHREALRHGASEAVARLAAAQHIPDWSAFSRAVAARQHRHNESVGAQLQEQLVMTGTARGRIMQMLSDFFSDALQAGRALRKAPAFALAAVATLAIGIGANVAIFSIADAVVFRPLPFADSARLAVIWNEYQGKPSDNSPPDYMDRVQFSRTMESLAAFDMRQADLTGRGEPVRIGMQRTTASFFTVLQAKPLLGRVYSAEEEQPGGAPVVVLSYPSWQSRFGGDRNILGSTITLNGTPRTVLGVMPPGFYLVEEVEAWVPLVFTTAQLADSNRGNEYLNVIGRMRPGVTLAQAESEMDAIAASVLTRVPQRRDFLSRVHWAAAVVPMLDQFIGEIRPAVLTVYAAVVLLLLMACVNVANLLLARAVGRRREISTRIALGASPGRLARLLLTEGLVLAAAGGLAGLVLSALAIRLVAHAEISGVPRLNEVALHWGTLSYTAGIVLATAILFGLAPIRFLLRENLAQGLQERGASAGRGPHLWASRMLVAGQLAMALLVLVSAGLLLRTFQNLSRTSPGFAVENRVTFRVSMPNSRYPDPPHRIEFVQRLSERLGAIPGVQHVGFSHRLPLIGINDTATIRIQGVELPAGAPPPGVELRTIDPGYLSAMGIPLLDGRNIDARDQVQSTPVALIDKQLAEKQWPGQNAIGKHLSFGDTNWLEVVGVVGSVKNAGLDVEGQGQVYLPQTQNAQASLYGVLVVANPTANWRATLAAVLQQIDPALPADDVKTMEQRVASSIGTRKHVSTLLSVFSALALLLAASGLYGLISYLVGQREREFAVRMALGAQSADVLRLVLAQGGQLVGAGLTLGILAGLALTRVIEKQLFGIAPTDWVTFTLAVVVLATVALAATALPARRATRVDPIRALRAE